MNKKARLTRSGCVLSAAVLLCCALAQPIVAHAATSVSDGVYVISSVASKKTVAVESNRKVSGGNVFQWKDNSRVGERWRLEKSGSHYVVRSVNTKLVLDVSGAGRANGTNVQLWGENGSAAQQWDLVDNGDGSYSLKSVCNGLVLDVSGGSGRDGANIQVWQSNGTAAQKFVLESTSSLAEGSYTVQSAASSSKAVDVPSASSSNGARVQLWEKNGSSAQRWSLTYDSQTGYYKMTAACSGKALDVPGGNGSNGVRIQQYQPNGSSAQSWDIRKSAGETYVIRTPLTSRALDVPGANAHDGAAVQLWDANGTKAQQWTFEPVASVVEDGLYAIKSSLDSSKVLDVESASTSPNARVQIYSSNSTLAQKWTVSYDKEAKAYSVKSANSGLYLTDADGTLCGSEQLTDESRWTARPGSGSGVTFVNVASGKALDLSGASTRSGSTVGTYAVNGTAAQSWKLEKVRPIEDGTYVLTTSLDHDMALDVSGGSKSDGAAVQVYKSNGTAAQAWTVKSLGSGYVSIANAGSGKALDVQNGSGSIGAVVQQYAPNGTPAQMWMPTIGVKGGIVLVSGLSNRLALGVSSSGSRTVLVDAGSDMASWSYAKTVVNTSVGGNAGSVSGKDASGLKYDKSYLDKMRAKAVQKGSDTNFYVCVDVDQARVTVLQKSGGSWSAVKTFDVTTGAYGGKWGAGTNNSKTGLFKLHHKAPALYEGTTWVNDYFSCFVTAWTANRRQGDFNLPSYPESRNSSTPYEMGQGFHYSIYAEFRAQGKSGYVHKGSGCICMLRDDAKWIYDNVPTGSTVESFASYNPNPTNWTIGSWPR